MPKSIPTIRSGRFIVRLGVGMTEYAFDVFNGDGIAFDKPELLVGMKKQMPIGGS